MSEPNEYTEVVLHHGTTMRAASSIIREGWQSIDMMDTVAQVAVAHGLRLDDLVQDLGKHDRYALGDGRGTKVSFAPNRGDAEHTWAQRAPEAKYESLWAAYRLKHMTGTEDLWDWLSDVGGHAWVWDQMRTDSLAVVSYKTCYAEMVEMGARNGGFRERPLLPLKLMFSPNASIAEIVYDVPFAPGSERISVTPVPRHLTWEVFAHHLGLSPDDFRMRAERGEFGPPASEGVSCPRMPEAPWWTSDSPFLAET